MKDVGARIYRKLAEEWLLVLALAATLVLSLALGRRPRFSADELEVVVLLGLLFASVRGLEQSGLMDRIACGLERGRHVAPKLVLATFVLAALVTNDVALVVVVPLTLGLRTGDRAALVMLEAFAANAGSALSPIGNPQNLYLYWHYRLDPLPFVATIAPFSLGLLAVLLLAALSRPGGAADEARPRPAVRRSALLYLALLGVLVGVVLRLLPFAAAWAVAAVLMVAGRDALARVDYALLATFLVLFALVDQFGWLLAPRLEHVGHVFAAAALTSQLIGNVPAAVLLAEFTSRWPALLWGVSVGGFGSLVASFANLIAWRLYQAREPDPAARRRFTLRFLLYGYLLFAFGALLYALWVQTGGRA